MSLDYIFIKSIDQADSIEKLKEDTLFQVDEYKDLGDELFPDIDWGLNNTAYLSIQGSLFEIEASDVSLAVRIKGIGAEPSVIFKLAAQCKDKNVVVVDVQTSELVTVKEAADNAERYKAWYQSVLG